jgi:hypothetical protein
MTTTVEPSAARMTQQQLAQLFQYTVEAYKTFEKLAENLPNPMSAMMFKQFAADERRNRDLLEMKAASLDNVRVRATLGPDLTFQDIIEGELSYREAAEFLIARERTFQRRVREFIGTSSAVDRSVLLYLESVKRSHVVELERELELIRIDGDWWKREDAEWRIIYGAPE